MTFKLAPALGPQGSVVARVLQTPAPVRAANDNGMRAGHEAPDDAILRAALRHFAQHGLGAARAARARAQEAFFSGDREAYDWWLSITRTLDRRLANEAAREQMKFGVQDNGLTPSEKPA